MNMRIKQWSGPREEWVLIYFIFRLNINNKEKLALLRERCTSYINQEERTMTIKGTNFTAEQLGPFEDLLEKDFMGFHGKYFLGQNLGLTGCEVSLNRLPAGKGMPFVHRHQKNEELYIVLRGSGVFYVDGKEFPLSEGSLIRLAPE